MPIKNKQYLVNNLEKLYTIGHKPNEFLLAFFDGIVKKIDISAKELLRKENLNDDEINSVNETRHFMIERLKSCQKECCAKFKKEQFKSEILPELENFYNTRKTELETLPDQKYFINDSFFDFIDKKIKAKDSEIMRLIFTGKWCIFSEKKNTQDRADFGQLIFIDQAFHYSLIKDRYFLTLDLQLAFDFLINFR